MDTTTTRESLATATIDPFTVEIIRHKLFRVIDEGLITLGKVSGTTVTAEGHDVLVALYLPDGTVLLAGLGFLHHILPASRAVKQIIESFSDDGIFEGDVFFANDPYSVAMHAPDIFMITPIHSDGKLASWVVNYVHVTDIGGVDVGGFCPNAREVYHEGFSTKGLKIVEKGKLRKDVYDTFLNMIRDPGMTGLDLKSQMSANHVVSDRMQRIYDDYGVDTVEAVSYQLIEQSEQRLRQRLRELPDGTWYAKRYLDLPHQTYRLELAATKDDDQLVFDFSGTDEQADFPINCQYWATKGAALAPLFPLLAWDMTWNEGIARCLDVVAPEGSLLNARRPAPISLNTISSVHAVNILSNEVLAKMLASSHKYQDRSVGCWLGTIIAEVVGGVNRMGEYVAQLSGDVFGMSEGARSFRDGAGSGGHIVNVAQKMANVESEEQAFPKLFLYRRVVPDSEGPGKYRGGPVHEHAVVPHGGGMDTITAVISPGTGETYPGAHGTSGGYPSSTASHRVFRNANVEEFPHNFDTTRGQHIEDVRASAVPVSTSDILYLRPDGGGGYGDPLDRDPELVLEDLKLRIVTAGHAMATYGVVIDEEQRKLDVEATRRQRSQMREQRLGKKPAVDERQDVARTPSRINEYLQVTDQGAQVQCTWCGEKICEVDARWKDAVFTHTSPVILMGPPKQDSSDYVLREFFCPSCATALDVEVVRPEDPPLYDVIHRWPR